MNHSCSPNCWMYFSGNKLQIRTLRDIEVDEELTISYLELDSPSAKRKAYLKEHYFFNCNCIRCENSPPEDKKISGIRCLNKGCKELVLEETNCSACNSKFDKTLVEYLVAKIKEQSERASLSRKEQQNENVVEALTLAINLQKQIYSQYHYELKDTYKELATIAERVEDFALSLRSHMHVLQFLEEFYPKNHPEVTLQLIRMGRIAFRLNNKALSLKYFKRGKELALLSHGSSSALIKILDEYIDLVPKVSKKY